MNKVSDKYIRVLTVSFGKAFNELVVAQVEVYHAFAPGDVELYIVDTGVCVWRYPAVFHCGDSAVAELQNSLIDVRRIDAFLFQDAAAAD